MSDKDFKVNFFPPLFVAFKYHLSYKFFSSILNSRQIVVYSYNMFAAGAYASRATTAAAASYPTTAAATYRSAAADSAPIPAAAAASLRIEENAKSKAFTATAAFGSGTSTASLTVSPSSAYNTLSPISSAKPPLAASGATANPHTFPKPSFRDLAPTAHMALGNYMGSVLSVHAQVTTEYSLFFQRVMATANVLQYSQFLVGPCFPKNFPNVEAERKDLVDYISVLTKSLAGVSELISKPKFDNIGLGTKFVLRKRLLFIRAALEEQAKQKEMAVSGAVIESADSPFGSITPRRGGLEAASIEQIFAGRSPPSNETLHTLNILADNTPPSKKRERFLANPLQEPMQDEMAVVKDILLDCQQKNIVQLIRYKQAADKAQEIVNQLNEAIAKATEADKKGLLEALQKAKKKLKEMQSAHDKVQVEQQLFNKFLAGPEVSPLLNPILTRYQKELEAEIMKTTHYFFQYKPYENIIRLIRFLKESDFFNRLNIKVKPALKDLKCWNVALHLAPSAPVNQPCFTCKLKPTEIAVCVIYNNFQLSIRTFYNDQNSEQTSIAMDSMGVENTTFGVMKFRTESGEPVIGHFATTFFKNAPEIVTCLGNRSIFRLASSMQYVEGSAAIFLINPVRTLEERHHFKPNVFSELMGKLAKTDLELTSI
jgi:hypothetical protein